MAMLVPSQKDSNQIFDVPYKDGLGAIKSIIRFKNGNVIISIVGTTMVHSLLQKGFLDVDLGCDKHHRKASLSISKTRNSLIFFMRLGRDK